MTSIDEATQQQTYR